MVGRRTYVAFPGGGAMQPTKEQAAGTPTAADRRIGSLAVTVAAVAVGVVGMAPRIRPTPRYFDELDRFAIPASQRPAPSVRNS